MASEAAGGRSGVPRMSEDGAGKEGGDGQNPLDPRSYFPSQEKDFFPAGGGEVFDSDQGSLRRQVSPSH